MKMDMIDLHIHTIYSDGTYTPEEVVRKAKELGLVAISITDHDSVSGLEEAISVGEKLGVEVVPGVEMSTDVGEDEIHILGYYLNWRESNFLSQLEEFQAARAKRNQKLIKKLESLGMRINYDELKGLAPRGVISRLHIARLMVKKGYVPSIEAAFEEWLNPGKPAYVEKMRVSPFRVIQSILKVGGIPVFAHPYLSQRDDLIPALVKSGLKGIEVYHSAHNAQVVEHYLRVAKKYHLLITGGSDCHGEAKDEILMGKVKVPALLLIELKKAKEEMECSKPI
ncbi:phosphatase [Candidatus Aerophobetes bacterium]|uniref:Phosphatase n=1 Tax=Aerophobetes bacterium TaxID=2030807 RepID=A0A662D1L8_UNCAE|nr:MAG: phosphatase [Candidatus Aerophobetes bacterium]